MIELKELERHYSAKERHFKRNILREYLQYKVLEVIYCSDYKNSLFFMGGTALRIVYGNDRFSEDLDFDNKGVSRENFVSLSDEIKRGLELEGYDVEMEIKTDDVYRCNLKFRGIYESYGLSGHSEETLILRIDTEPQNYDYEPEKSILNRFDVFVRINNVSPELLLAQKITAIFKRPRTMGRDFFDAIFLFGKTSPDMDYLRDKLNISNSDELKKELLEKCSGLNFEKLAKNAEPFIINKNALNRILHFEEFVSEKL